jgi:hypothetical protein
MLSPKFPQKRKDIEEVINPTRLRSRWREKVREAMRHQAMPDPVEHLDFHINLESICISIAAEIYSGTYIPRPPIRLLSEKSKGLCRQLVVPSAKDALILQTLSDALWVDLQKKAPSKNAFYAPNDNQFSRIIRGQSSEYGSINAWISFQEAIFGFARTRKFIVVTDITNYYDFISYDHLRNILADLAIAREHCLDLLIYTLSHMLWQPDYMPRVQVGLPQIDLDAPRLLAHCFLFEIDKVLIDGGNADFARYMDDIDIGVDTIAEAKRVLRDLDLSLQTRQIRLNSGKTQILTEPEARVHFRIRENAFLDRLEDAMIAKRSTGSPLCREVRFITTVIQDGLRRRAFDSGNGEKILKRCINYARKYHAPITDDDFLRILLKWPTVRETVLKWWQHSDRPAQKLELIYETVRNAEIIDDQTFIDVAVAVVAARLPRDSNTSRVLEQINCSLDHTKTWGFYAKTWLLSKYGSVDQILNILEVSVSLWVTEEHLSRLVGGLFPRFIGSTLEGQFQALARRSGSPWCSSVLDFHESLARTARGFNSVQKFVRAPNPSFPNRISHAKFLMLCSMTSNSMISGSRIEELRSGHAYALGDAFYREILQ